MKNQANSTVDVQNEIWNKAPQGAFHWERLPKGKCIWHCRMDGRTFDKKAPNFEIQQNSLWRDADKQKEADRSNASVNKQLKALNIVLA